MHLISGIDLVEDNIYALQILDRLSRPDVNTAIANLISSDVGQIGNTVSSRSPSTVDGYGQRLTDSDFDYFSTVSARGPNGLLFISGVRNQTMAERVWAGYTGGTSGNYTGINTYLDEQATIIANEIVVAQGGKPATRAWGHSAGGALAWMVLKKLRTSFESFWTPYVTMYGTPKFFHANRYAEWVPWDSRHYMRDDDPVPLIPPELTWWTRVTASLSTWQGRSLSFFNGIPRGISLPRNGPWVSSASPLGIIEPPETAIASWINAQTNGRDTNHSIGSYLDRFRSYRAAPSNVPTVLPQPIPVVSQNPITNVESRRQIAVSQSIILSTDRSIQAPQLVLPTELQFVARRVGRIWYVDWQGNRIFTAPSKKRARGMARVGNDFLRRLLLETNTDVDGLVHQMVRWLADAQAIDGPIQPPLNSRQQ